MSQLLEDARRELARHYLLHSSLELNEIAYVELREVRQSKAVFCEKPLAISTSDGETMVEVAKQTKVANALNFALADRHAALEIERALKAGEVGDVCGVDGLLAVARRDKVNSI